MKKDKASLKASQSSKLYDSRSCPVRHGNKMFFFLTSEKTLTGWNRIERNLKKIFPLRTLTTV